MPRLFVSHVASDEELVEEFVDLLQVGVGIHPDDIFCSSLPGMNIPNLTVIGPDTKAKVIEILDSTQPMVAELEEKAIALSAPQQLSNSAKLRSELASKRQRIIFGVALLLFCVGVAVFARASINWYQRVQRYEDAKLRHEANDLVVDGSISLWANVLWLAGPLIVASFLWVVLIWLAI